VIIQIQAYPVILLLQARLSLLHVVWNRVGGNKRRRLVAVVPLGCLDEVALEARNVDIQVLAVGVGVINAQSD
jgi:hypothetical protein